MVQLQGDVEVWAWGDQIASLASPGPDVSRDHRAPVLVEGRRLIAARPTIRGTRMSRIANRDHPR